MKPSIILHRPYRSSYSTSTHIYDITIINNELYKPYMTDSIHIFPLQIINFYFNIVVSEFNERQKDSEIYTFNTHFYHKLSKSGFEGVRKWTKKVYLTQLITITVTHIQRFEQIDIFECKLILIPVHSGCHWSLVVVDCRKEEIEYYDSLGGNGTFCTIRIR